VGDDGVTVGDTELVGVGELLAEADGLADREVFGDDVGLTDFVGLGLPVGLGAVDGCSLVTLILGVGLGRGLAVLDAELGLGGFTCCSVLLPVFPLVWPVE
jgi:hypothetical protein